MQQRQQQGGSQYGVPPPDMAPFASPGAGPRTQMLGIPTAPDNQQQLAETASPISSRPAPPSSQNYDELVPTVPGNFPDDDALAAGEELERGGVPGNRWPRQETLALLKIRSDMDAAFRDATLKGPLWELVSRKLAEQGFIRSAKKCKEKFENVHKYYKRTKEGRAGRQDGKSYRFFSQLEALQSGGAAAGGSSSTTPTTMANPITSVPAASTTTAPIGISSRMPGPSLARVQPPPVSVPTPTPTATPTRAAPDLTPTTDAAAAPGMSFSSDTFSSSSSESDDAETEEGSASREGRKRKREGGSGGSRKMMAFFEGLMKQVMEKQEAMQQRFVETIEKREQDRMIREEAWKRQEMARLNREHELLAQEHAMAASRDAAVISFLQKISGQAIQLPPAVAIPAAPPPQPSPTPPPQQPPQPQQPQQTLQDQQKPLAPPPQPPPQQQQPPELHVQHQSTESVRNQLSSASAEQVPVPEQHEVVASGTFEGVSPSRWPKLEVHALIKLRSGLEVRYQEPGPKGPLWEDISARMQQLGYNRSAKRCKEKWENINKYFKKVKESNKKRPEDAKTCPYFHELDALYRKKLQGSSGGSTSSGVGFLGNQRQQEQENIPNPQERRDVLMSMAPPQAPQQHPHPETESKSGNNNNRNGGNPEGAGSSGGIQIQTSNGGLPPSLFEEGTSGGSATMKKPEDIVKELMEQKHQQSAMDDYDKLEDPDSDHIDQDDDDDDEDGDDGEDRKMQYKIQFQRQNLGGGGNASAKAAATSAAGSFLGIVQ